MMKTRHPSGVNEESAMAWEKTVTATSSNNRVSQQARMLTALTDRQLKSSTGFSDQNRNMHLAPIHLRGTRATLGWARGKQLRYVGLVQGGSEERLASQGEFDAMMKEPAAVYLRQGTYFVQRTSEVGPGPRSDSGSMLFEAGRRTGRKGKGSSGRPASCISR